MNLANLTFQLREAMMDEEHFITWMLRALRVIPRLQMWLGAERTEFIWEMIRKEIRMLEEAGAQLEEYGATSPVARIRVDVLKEQMDFLGWVSIGENENLPEEEIEEENSNESKAVGTKKKLQRLRQSLERKDKLIRANLQESESGRFLLKREDGIIQERIKDLEHVSTFDDGIEGLVRDIKLKPNRIDIGSLVVTFMWTRIRLELFEEFALHYPDVLTQLIARERLICERFADEIMVLPDIPDEARKYAEEFQIGRIKRVKKRKN